MNANASNTKPVFDDSGLEDGGAIGNLPRFAPPAPEVQQPVPLSGETPEAVKVESPATEQAQPAVAVAPVEPGASVEQPSVVASDAPATVVLNDEGAIKPVDAAAAASTSPVEPGVAKGPSAEVNESNLLTGVLIEHGEAKFNFDKDESANYYVKYLDDDNVEKVLWGVDLKRAVQDGGVEVGQRVEFLNRGQEEVQVNAPVRDAEGKVTGYELKDVLRNTWEVRPAPAPALANENNPAPEVKPGAATLDEQLRMISQAILAQRGADPSHPQARLTQEELDRVAQHLNLQGGVRPDPTAATLLQPIGAAAAPGGGAPNTATVGVTAGQSVQMKGGAAIAEGAAALVGGALNLAGTAGKVVGQAAHHVADLMKPKEAGRQAEAAQAEAVASGLPAVLPRLSEYRIAQVEKAADNFGQEADAFWNSSTKLTALRSEMERVARERGLSVQDVAEKMKPGGDFAELREKFNAAVAENPDSGTRKKAMDKALDSYVRQYGRAQEELLNPEQNGNPHYDRYKDRLHRAHENIEQKSSGVPAFANDKGELEPSHFEKLKEAVAKIMEKLKEVAKEFVAMFRGKSAGDDHAPAP